MRRFLILLIMTAASKHDFRRDWWLDFLITHLIKVFITASSLCWGLLILTYLFFDWFRGWNKLTRDWWSWHLRSCLNACFTSSNDTLFSDSTPPHFLFLLTFEDHILCLRIEVTFLLTGKVTDWIHGYVGTGWELCLILIYTRIFKARSVMKLSMWWRHISCLLNLFVYTLDYTELA